MRVNSICLKMWQIRKKHRKLGSHAFLRTNFAALGFHTNFDVEVNVPANVSPSHRARQKDVSLNNSMLRICLKCAKANRWTCQSTPDYDSLTLNTRDEDGGLSDGSVKVWFAENLSMQQCQREPGIEVAFYVFTSRWCITICQNFTQYRKFNWVFV